MLTLNLKLNTQLSKTYKWDKQEKKLVLEVNPESFSSADLAVVLRDKLKSLDESCEVNAQSFVDAKLFDGETLAVALASAVEYANNQRPFNKKTSSCASCKAVKTTLVNTEGLVDLKQAQVLASAQTFARKLQDMPSNYLNPLTFVQEVQNLYADLKNKVTIKVLAPKKEMGLLRGVCQGCKPLTDLKGFTEADRGCLIVLEYNSAPENKKLALVGKGVCFDTGGYSLKTSGYMVGMKFDMSGAAAVAASVYALAKNDVKTNVVGVLGLVENLISLNSYRVDDVLTSYNGKTVEVDNTDAEGRLVLADCLTYAVRDLKADAAITIATLTGAIISALGSTYGGAWSTSENNWNLLNTAAQKGAEGIWRMPFHNDFLSLLQSSYVADIKNSCKSPKGGSIRAAMFLKEFSDNKPYMHLDIAGMDSLDNGSGTGPGVRTLYKLAELFAKK